MSAIARLRWARRIDPPCDGRSIMREVLGELVDCADRAGEAWPSLAYLAEHTGYTQRAVRGAVQRLEMHGYLQRKHDPGRVNRYLIQFPSMLPKLGRDQTDPGTTVPGYPGTNGPGTPERTDRGGRNSRSGDPGTNGPGTPERTDRPNRNSELNSEENSEENYEGEPRAPRAPSKPPQYCRKHPNGGEPCHECKRLGLASDEWLRRYGCRASNCGEPTDPDEPEYHYCTRHLTQFAPSNRRRRTKEPDQ